MFGWFEPDEATVPFFTSVGRAVAGAAALEKALQFELARLLHAEHQRSDDAESASLQKELSKLDRKTAGQLLDELQKLGLPGDLSQRIRTAVDRRNDLVHRFYEDPELARATAGGADLKRVIERVDRLALDCAELAVELEMFAWPRVQELTGMSLAEMVELVISIDPSNITDPRERKQLEAVQAFAKIEDLSTLFENLGPPGPSEQ